VRCLCRTAVVAVAAAVVGTGIVVVTAHRRAALALAAGAALVLEARIATDAERSVVEPQRVATRFRVAVTRSARAVEAAAIRRRFRNAGVGTAAVAAILLAAHIVVAAFRARGHLSSVTQARTVAALVVARARVAVVALGVVRHRPVLALVAAPAGRSFGG